jgi:hypothetical protein
MNSQPPDRAGTEDATQTDSLVDRFQALRVAPSRNPFADQRSSESPSSNPFRGSSRSSQPRSTRGPSRSSTTPGPGRSADNSDAFQQANLGPYLSPPGSVGYRSGYGQSSSGLQCDPRSIRRSATSAPPRRPETTQPRDSRQPSAHTYVTFPEYR